MASLWKTFWSGSDAPAEKDEKSKESVAAEVKEKPEKAPAEAKEAKNEEEVSPSPCLAPHFHFFSSLNSASSSACYCTS